LPIEKLTLTVAEAAQALGVAESTLFLQIKSGRVPSFQIGRRRLISKAALTAMLSTFDDMPKASER
jgi:excisionase family DNA binding protein